MANPAWVIMHMLPTANQQKLVRMLPFVNRSDQRWFKIESADGGILLCDKDRCELPKSLDPPIEYPALAVQLGHSHFADRLDNHIAVVDRGDCSISRAGADEGTNREGQVERID